MADEPTKSEAAGTPAEWPGDVHFGDVDKPLPDWHKSPIVDDEDPDDEDIPAPPDVIAILGFDPSEEDE